MSIQEWAAIAEIISALAVVASLVYLALQIRQNTHGLSMSMKSTELSAFERNVESGNRIRQMFIENGEVAELYTRGIKSFMDLGETDKIRFGMILSNVFSALQGAFVRQETYGNDPDNLAGSERMLDAMIKQPGVRSWLNRNEPDWRPQFATFVKQRVQYFEQHVARASESAETS